MTPITDRKCQDITITTKGGNDDDDVLTLITDRKDVIRLFDVVCRNPWPHNTDTAWRDLEHHVQTRATEMLRDNGNDSFNVPAHQSGSALARCQDLWHAIGQDPLGFKVGSGYGRKANFGTVSEKGHRDGGRWCPLQDAALLWWTLRRKVRETVNWDDVAEEMAPFSKEACLWTWDAIVERWAWQQRAIHETHVLNWTSSVR